MPFATFYARPEDDLVWTGSAMTAAATYISEGRRLGNDILVAMGLEIAHVIEYQMIERFDRGYMFNFPEYWPNIDSNTYAYSGGNRFRVGLDVMNSLKPLHSLLPVPEAYLLPEPSRWLGLLAGTALVLALRRPLAFA